MAGKEIEKLIKTIAKLPALGTRSARRIVLQLLKKKNSTDMSVCRRARQMTAGGIMSLSRSKNILTKAELPSPDASSGSIMQRWEILTCTQAIHGVE